MLSFTLMALLQAGSEPAADTSRALAGSLLDRLKSHVTHAATKDVEALTMMAGACTLVSHDAEKIARRSNSVIWKIGRVHRQVELSPLGTPERFFLMDFELGLSARFHPAVPGRSAVIHAESVGTSPSEEFGWRSAEFDTLRRLMQSIGESLGEPGSQIVALKNSLTVRVPCDPRHPRPSMLGVPGNDSFLTEGTSILHSLELVTTKDGADWWSLTVQLTGRGSAVVRSSYFSGIGHQGLPFRFLQVIDYDPTGSTVIFARFQEASALDAAVCEPLARGFDQFSGVMVRDRRLPDGHLTEYAYSGSFPSLDELRRLR